MEQRILLIVRNFLLVLIIQIISFPDYAQKIASKKDKEVSIELEEGTLYGSLLVPKSKKAVPVVLLIPGSGPTDRNCNSSMGLKSNSFLLLAEELYEKGIATLRVDKRASGKSLETFINSIDSINFFDFSDDAMKWIDFLKEDTRFSKIIVAGHSQGSLVGMLAANNREVDGFISLSGAGRMIQEVLYDQLHDSFNYDVSADTLKMFLDSIQTGTYFNDAPKKMRQTLPKDLLPFLNEWFGVDPEMEIKALKCPVAIIQGAHDLQVSVQEAEILHNARNDAYYEVFPEMNHILKDTPEEPFANYAAYNDPDLPITAGLSDSIYEFIEKWVLTSE